jgi:hypothetical protein
MQVSRNEAGGEALMAITVDSPLSAEIVASVRERLVLNSFAQ